MVHIWNNSTLLPQRQRLKSESALSTVRDEDLEDVTSHHVNAVEMLGVAKQATPPPSTSSQRLNKPAPRQSDIGLFGSKIDHSTPFSFNLFSNKEASDDVNKPVARARSSTMDHGSMQRFVRGLTRNT